VAGGHLVGACALLIVSLGLAACGTGTSLGRGSDHATGSLSTDAAGEEARVPVGRLSANIPRGSDPQPVDTVVRVTAHDAYLTSVTLSSPAGRVDGVMSRDGARWAASERLEPGESYSLRGVAEGADGTPVRLNSAFVTEALALDQQTYASVSPLAGETVGVGMPVIVSFDVPVTDRAEFERHMTVTSTPRQRGSWHWFSGKEARWRPAKYWRPGTKVSVDIDINGVAAGDGIYGQKDRFVDFKVGDAHVYEVNAESHQMKVFSNGRLLRTLPVTTGKPGFTTRSGTKVIMEKYASKRMNSETVGIPAGSSEAYDLDNVRWAMRVTNSGEFLHAAPWSTGSQGYANVSHGCTGLSTADAGWLYAMSRRGDVVVYKGTNRPMTLDNGYGDWNASFRDYREGSALR
jgi:lipoprotein-anchoring transpeptidase ErfK/SrfK